MKQLKARHRYTEFLFKKFKYDDHDVYHRWKLSKYSSWNPFYGTTGESNRHAFRHIATDGRRASIFKEYEEYMDKYAKRHWLINNRFNPEVGHSPSALHKKGRAIGIELECIIPLSGISKFTTLKYDQRTDRNLYNFIANIMREECKKRKIKNVTVGSDGSIGKFDVQKAAGFEFKLLTTLDDLSNLKELCKLLREVNTFVNRTCGTHVHLDQRHNDVKAALTVATRLNNALFGLKFLVPKNRQENSFCQLIATYPHPFQEYIQTELKEKDKSAYEMYSKFKDSVGRYGAINASAYVDYKSIEVRLHSGTVSYTKIANWIDILINICNNKNFDSETFYGKELLELKHNETLMRLFINMCAFPKEKEYLKEYILLRFNKFKRTNSENEYMKTSVLRNLIGTERTNSLHGEKEEEIPTVAREPSRTSLWRQIQNSLYSVDASYIVNEVDHNRGVVTIDLETESTIPPVEFNGETDDDLTQLALTRDGWDVYRPTLIGETGEILANDNQVNLSEVASRDDPVGI